MSRLALLLAAALTLVAATLSAAQFSGGRYEPTYSFRPPFLFGRGSAVAHFQFYGSAVVTEDFVRLTPDRQSHRGALWSTTPSTMTAWETVFEFKIHGQGRATFGDGLAFWYLVGDYQQGPIYGSHDSFFGLGVFFDTFDNDLDRQNPTVVVAIGDGQTPYDYAHDGRSTSLGSCRAELRNTAHRIAARVTYVGMTLTVSIDVSGKGEWRVCTEHRNVVLPNNGFFGFSAETGDVADNHDVFTMTTRDLSRVPIRADGAAGAAASVPVGNTQAIDKETSSGVASFFMVILFVFVLVASGVGYFIFKSRRPRKAAFL